MKKNGFTLAEVLITLAIIGVVATLTLPSLMANTAEQQAVTGFRKAMNTLNEAGQMNAALEGFDYGQLVSNVAPTAANAQPDENGQIPRTLWALLANRAQVDMTASTNAASHAGMGTNCNQSVIIFRDGTALCFTPNDANTNGAADATIHAWVDTNGVKAPNTASRCTASTCAKNGRSINDQFRITLRGSIAIPGHVTYSNGVITEGTEPEDNAASWAMRK